MTPFIIGWIIAIVAFISIEAATIQLISIWFMGGALAGMIAAMCGLGFVWQFGLFVAVSALLLAIFRPILRKKLTPKHTRTNADRLIGREALVTEPIDDLRATGAVRVDGVLLDLERRAVAVRGGQREARDPALRHAERQQRRIVPRHDIPPAGADVPRRVLRQRCSRCR